VKTGNIIRCVLKPSRENVVKVSGKAEDETGIETAKLQSVRCAVEPTPIPAEVEPPKVVSPNLVPITTLALIGLNVLFFILEEMKGGSQNISVLIQMGAVTSSTLAHGEYFRILLAPFLHVGPDHLISNMYALFFIGWALERVYDHLRIAVVYFLSGIVGSLLSAVTIPIGVVGAGASGAILGCLVALVVLQSRFSHVSFGVGVGTAVLALCYDLLAGLMPGSGVDNAAHFGGAIGGLLLALTVSPPTKFLSHVAAQMNLSYTPEQLASAEQLRQTSKHKPRYLKIILTGALVVIVLVGVFAFAVYPRLSVGGVRLSASTSARVAGSVTLQIGGSGLLVLQSVIATLDNIPLSVGYNRGAYVLPQQFVLSVTGYSNLSPLAVALGFSSTLVITLDGVWAPPFGSTPTIPVHITAEEAIKWSR
jgi:membrane associated rhomboid family serine protease